MQGCSNYLSGASSKSTKRYRAELSREADIVFINFCASRIAAAIDQLQQATEFLSYLIGCFSSSSDKKGVETTTAKTTMGILHQKLQSSYS